MHRIILCAFNCKILRDVSGGWDLVRNEPFFKYTNVHERREEEAGYWLHHSGGELSAGAEIASSCMEISPWLLPSGRTSDLIISFLSSLCLIWANIKRQENLPRYLTYGTEMPVVSRLKPDNSGWGRGKSCDCRYGEEELWGYEHTSVVMILIKLSICKGWYSKGKKQLRNHNEKIGVLKLVSAASRYFWNDCYSWRSNRGNWKAKEHLNRSD